MSTIENAAIAFCTSDGVLSEEERWALSRHGGGEIQLFVYGTGRPEQVTDLFLDEGTSVRIDNITRDSPYPEMIINDFLSRITGKLTVDVTGASPYHAALAGVYGINSHVVVCCARHDGGLVMEVLNPRFMDYSALDSSDAAIVRAIYDGCMTVESVVEETCINQKTAYRRIRALEKRGLISIDSRRKQKVLTLDPGQARMMTMTREEPR